MRGDTVHVVCKSYTEESFTETSMNLQPMNLSLTNMLADYLTLARFEQCVHLITKCTSYTIATAKVLSLMVSS